MPLSEILGKIQYVTGGMKMTDENERKPFYKRNWFWITILSIFIVVTATTYVANYSFYSDKADQASTSQTRNAAQKKVDDNPSLTVKYDSIKTGKDGFTRDEIIDLLGQPTTTQQIDGTKELLNLTWNTTENNNKIVIQITVEKNRATAKSIQGLDIDRKKLLTLEDFDKLQIGDKYNKVVNTLGDPDDYSDTDGIKTLTYESDLAEADPTADAMIKIEVSNNQIISKDQQNLK